MIRTTLAFFARLVTYRELLIYIIKRERARAR